MTGTAIGFFLAWLLLAWPLSALLGARVRTKTGAALALVAPMVVATAAIGALAASSVLGPDHCPEHVHHPHLCLLHGQGWAERSAPSAAAAGAAALVLVAVAARAASALRSIVLVRRLRRYASWREGAWVVDSGEAFCFTAGLLRPEPYVSSGAVRLLSDAERRAMLAHERAHVRAFDPACQLVLSFCAALGAPYFADSVLRTWRRSSERRCDAVAAREVSPVAVAEALVKMARATVSSHVAFGPSRDEISSRVEAVLDEASEPPTPTTVPVLLLCVAIAAAIGWLEPLHHVLESILGSF